jgi:hypothetical protein
VKGLHEPVELGPEAALAEVRAGVDEMSLPFAPFCPPVLEPDLKQQNLHYFCNYFKCSFAQLNHLHISVAVSHKKNAATWFRLPEGKFMRLQLGERNKAAPTSVVKNNTASATTPNWAT